MTDYEYAAFNEEHGMVGLGPTELDERDRRGVPEGVRQDVIDWRRDGWPDTHVRRRPIGGWERFDSDLDPTVIPVYDSARRQVGTATVDGLRINATITDAAMRESMAFGKSSLSVGPDHRGDWSATIVDGSPRG